MREQGSVHYVRKTDELILFIAGEVTAHLAQSMYAHLAASLDPPSFRRIYAELSTTSYVDSTTIGTFIKLKKILERHEGELILCNPSAKVKRILSDMHLLAYFTVTESSALKDIRRDVLTKISPDHKDLLSSDYLLDAHRTIVQEAPHLQEEFDSLIKTLESQTQARVPSGNSGRRT
ncbi:MAG: STAS domain-containing protein [Spirochaetota bacterium]